MTGPVGATGAGAILYWGIDNIGGGTAIRYMSPGHDFAVAPLTDTMQIPLPRGGTMRNFIVYHNDPVGDPTNMVTYTVLVDGVATALTVTLAANAAGPVIDAVNTVAVGSTQRVSVSLQRSSSMGTSMIDPQASVELA